MAKQKALTEMTDKELVQLFNSIELTEAELTEEKEAMQYLPDLADGDDSEVVVEGVVKAK